MLVFAKVFVSFLSEGNHFLNIFGLFIFVYISFSHYNFFPLDISQNPYNIYQHFHYLNRSYYSLKLDYKVSLICSGKDGKKLDRKADEYP